MSRLKHRTRDGSSIKFKTNVFFAAHPQEHDRFFDEVVRDFIDICDCVIWYDACPAQEYDEQLRLDLSRMRIIVIPVTRRLLTEENPVTTRLLVFALEQHIHILPILFEDVPDWMYGRYFGKRQYLSKIDQDPTLVPYGQKLKKHLESVLISGEMMERIRREFDGYIFLSYRKKDRLLANELMSLIHSYPHLRDVAIWYDEFLNPGEEFEGDIRRAMEKSKLFALLVTPNLLEEPNYVKNNEYPEARKLGMRILPAQMAPTDREQLFRDYEFLALPVDARDREALEEALNSGLSGIALKAKATSAEHEYLIGLAYLEGIDVEINRGLAIKMISHAAENGCVEAMEKMVYIYFWGIGCKRNDEKAVFWQRSVLRVRKNEYLSQSSEASRQRYLRELYNLAEHLTHMCSWSELTQVYGQILSELTESADGADNERIVYVLNELGVILSRCDNPLQASCYLIQGINRAKKLLQKNETRDIRYYLALLQCNLGMIMLNASDYRAAENFLEESFCNFEYLCNKTNDIDMDRDALKGYAVSSLGLGRLYMALKNWSSAEEYFKVALFFAKDLAKKRMLRSDYFLAAQCYMEMGQFLVATGRIDYAEKAYQISLDIHKCIMKTLSTPEVQISEKQCRKLIKKLRKKK